MKLKHTGEMTPCNSEANFKRKLMMALLPIALGALGGFASSRFEDGKLYQKVQDNTEDIIILNEKKAEQDVLVIFKEQLDRIETKVDRLDEKIK